MIKNARRSHICQGVFSIFENFLKIFGKTRQNGLSHLGERMKGSLCLLFLPVGTGRR